MIHVCWAASVTSYNSYCIDTTTSCYRVCTYRPVHLIWRSCFKIYSPFISPINYNWDLYWFLKNMIYGGVHLEFQEDGSYVCYMLSLMHWKLMRHWNRVINYFFLISSLNTFQTVGLIWAWGRAEIRDPICSAQDVWKQSPQVGAWRWGLCEAASAL